jgi:hypothetical protein
MISALPNDAGRTVFARTATRIFTAALVTLVGLIAMAEGWDIVRFSLAAQQNGDGTDPEAFRAWTDVSGLSFNARDAALTAIANSSGEGRSHAIEEQLANILSVKPVSPGYWLSLARMRFAEQSRDAGMQAFSLSVLTGANEGNVMPWRGILGLSLWETAPADVKRRAIADLASALAYMNGQQAAAMQLAVKGKTDEIRQQIRSLLLAAGAPTAQLPGVGLPAK